MIRRHIVFGVSAAFALFVAGCTVQPLHSNNSIATVSSVTIKSVDTRIEQEVRNRLIFLLNGGKQQPADPAYEVKLDVKSVASNLLKVPTNFQDSDTTARKLVLTGTAEIRSTSDGELVKTFKRKTTVSFDKSTQLFANSRAQIDAEDRAAIELAEELRNLISGFVKER